MQACFNTQPPEGGWGLDGALLQALNVSTHSRPKAAGRKSADRLSWVVPFQHTAARRRLGINLNHAPTCTLFQHTAARRRLESMGQTFIQEMVSFNTQPPEGGWVSKALPNPFYGCFNTQPPEGGWFRRRLPDIRSSVSTHSRPKAAGIVTVTGSPSCNVSTHSRPKAAGVNARIAQVFSRVSTHSRPKAAGCLVPFRLSFALRFQHTAARRRLAVVRRNAMKQKSFNTQPPEGGWRIRI